MGAIRAIPVLLNKLPDIMRAVGKSLKGIITAIFGDIFAGAGGVIDAFTGTFGDIFDDIKGILTGKTTVI